MGKRCIPQLWQVILLSKDVWVYSRLGHPSFFYSVFPVGGFFRNISRKNPINTGWIVVFAAIKAWMEWFCPTNISLGPWSASFCSPNISFGPWALRSVRSILHSVHGALGSVRPIFRSVRGALRSVRGALHSVGSIFRLSPGVVSNQSKKCWREVNGDYKIFRMW